SLPLFHTLTHPSCCYQWKWDSQTTVFHPAGHKTWEPRLGSVFRAQDSGLRAQAHTHTHTHTQTLIPLITIGSTSWTPLIAWTGRGDTENGLGQTTWIKWLVLQTFQTLF